MDPDQLKKPVDLALPCLQYSFYLVQHCFNERIYIILFQHSKVI